MPNPNLLWSVLTNKCSRCREGHLFVHGNPYKLRSFMQMHEKCPECGQLFEIEVGFWYGASITSYTMSVLFCAVSFIAWKLTIGMSLNDNRFFWWMGVNAILLVLIQPPLMRLSRTIWLYFFVRYDPDWRQTKAKTPERLNQDLKNDW